MGNLLFSPNAAQKDLKFIGGLATNPVSMIIKDGGNVGIGTTSPIRTLQVVGNVQFDGDLGERSEGITFKEASRPRRSSSRQTQGLRNRKGPRARRDLKVPGPEGPSRAAVTYIGACTQVNQPPQCPHGYEVNPMQSPCTVTLTQDHARLRALGDGARFAFHDQHRVDRPPEPRSGSHTSVIFERWGLVACLVRSPYRVPTHGRVEQPPCGMLSRVATVSTDVDPFRGARVERSAKPSVG